jgi:hypothetical protein
MDESQKEKTQRRLAEAMRAPEVDGICDKCGGPVIMPHTGVCFAGLSHNLPQCMRCHAIYLTAPRVHKETYQEYKKRKGNFRVDI